MLHSRFQKTDQSGFIKIAIVLVVFVGVVWYFNLDIHAFVEDHPKIKSFFENARDFILRVFS